MRSERGQQARRNAWATTGSGNNNNSGWGAGNGNTSLNWGNSNGTSHHSNDASAGNGWNRNNAHNGNGRNGNNGNNGWNLNNGNNGWNTNANNGNGRGRGKRNASISFDTSLAAKRLKTYLLRTFEQLKHRVESWQTLSASEHSNADDEDDGEESRASSDGVVELQRLDDGAVVEKMLWQREATILVVWPKGLAGRRRSSVKPALGWMGGGGFGLEGGMGRGLNQTVLNPMGGERTVDEEDWDFD